MDLLGYVFLMVLVEMQEHMLNCARASQTLTCITSTNTSLTKVIPKSRGGYFSLERKMAIYMAKDMDTGLGELGSKVQFVV